MNEDKKFNKENKKENEVSNDINSDEPTNEVSNNSIENKFINGHKIEVKEVIEKDEKVKNKDGFFTKVMAQVVDQTIILLGSVAILFIFDIIIKLMGFYISERIAVYAIIYLITNVLYAPVLESSKLRATIGKKIFNRK